MKRTVLITGSTRGIGFATAAEFLRHGDRVVIHPGYGHSGLNAFRLIGSGLGNDYEK